MSGEKATSDEQVMNKAKLLGVKPMVNPPPQITTVPTDTWIAADWEDFLTFANDPTLVNGRFYYNQGYMGIEMS